MYPGKSQNKILLWVTIPLLYLWVIIGTKFYPWELVSGWKHMMNLISSMLPPNWSVIPEMWEPMLETIQIALLGTTLAAIFGLIFAIFAAKNTTPHPILYNVSRWLLNFFRSVPDLVFALLFVAAVGLGPFPGVLAIAIHNTGVLGKIYAEFMESANPTTQEAITSTGANRLQIIRYGVIPEILPNIVSYTLFRWECNVRSSTVLGIVGAGGIGLHLLTSLRLFQYQKVIAIILVIIVMVAIMEFIGSNIRKRII